MIGLLTSGGDAPGMNAAIRAVVRTALFNKVNVTGIMRGYEGLIDGDFVKMTEKSVANIILRGGTVLKTARSDRFMTEEGMQQAHENLKANGIKGLIVTGGNGTFAGGVEFNQVFGFPVIGIPATIDNDISGTDYSIGFDSALNTVIEATDKIRDTAESHDRLFIVEVMGRESGMIALYSGLASGAEAILIPEISTSHSDIISRLRSGRKSKRSRILIVAEGEPGGGALVLASEIKKQLPALDTRVSILGHMQRGGAPTCVDRVNASKLGYGAVQAWLKGETNVMAGLNEGKIEYSPLNQATTKRKISDNELMEMMQVLAS